MRFDRASVLRSRGKPAPFLVRDAREVRRDPTGTTAIRRRWEADLEQRFRALKRKMRDALVTQDVLGLKGTADSLPRQLMRQTFHTTYMAAPAITTDDTTPLSRERFAFARPAEKVDAFMRWLYDQQVQGILGIETGTPQPGSSQASWQNIYIDHAYQKGIRDARGNMGMDKDAGPVLAAFNQPIHADAVGLIYTRAFNDLEGINDVMSSRISNVLANGMAAGLGVMDIARDMEQQVEGIGIVRARTLARTETIAAHAEAALNSYEDAEMEGVEVVAEFATAGDDQVCPECEDLEGKEMSIDEARGLIPVHPNCRCTFIPVTK